MGSLTASAQPRERNVSDMLTEIPEVMEKNCTAERRVRACAPTEVTVAAWADATDAAIDPATAVDIEAVVEAMMVEATC